MINEKIKKELEEIQDLVGDVYASGYLDGRDENKTYQYKHGLDDAWECARKIIKIWYSRFHQDPNAFNDFFELNGKLGDDIFDLFFQKYSASEVIEKLKQYEEQKKPALSVGDMVIYKDDINDTRRTEYVVTYVYQNGTEFDAITTDGMVYTEMRFNEDMVKIGKRYEIHLKEASDD